MEWRQAFGPLPPSKEAIMAADSVLAAANPDADAAQRMVRHG